MYRTGVVAISALAITALLAGNLSVQAQARVEGKAPAQQPNAVGDPLKVIYRISGIADSGSAAGRAGHHDYVHQLEHCHRDTKYRGS